MIPRIPNNGRVRTVGDVYNELTPEQKDVFHYLIGLARQDGYQSLAARIHQLLNPKYRSTNRQEN